jgi:O-acetyl-ADP-ribose deacetylase (regulator of RNase III)
MTLPLQLLVFGRDGITQDEPVHGALGQKGADGSARDGHPGEKEDPVEKFINGLRIECIEGDITKQPDIEAIVNAANARLRTGGGVAGAIHRAAGPELEQESVPLGPLKPGQAVITSGHRLPNPYVIHCLGPVYGVDVPSDRLLAECYRNALSLADERCIASVAFPAISTGVFGYPIADAARVALRAVADVASGLKTVTLVRFVLHGREALEAHEAALAALAR